RPDPLRRATGGGIAGDRDAGVSAAARWPCRRASDNLTRDARLGPSAGHWRFSVPFLPWRSLVSSDLPSGRQPLTFRHWLILILAAIGFGFDIYVLLIMQYIGRDLLVELLPNADPATRAHWKGLLFWVPMLVGGAVGLVGGYLTDLLGRRRVLT